MVWAAVMLVLCWYGLAMPEGALHQGLAGAEASIRYWLVLRSRMLAFVPQHTHLSLAQP